MTIWEHFSEEEIKLLKERAQNTKKAEEALESNTVLSLLVSINSVRYALPVNTLVAVYINVPIVPVPGLPSYYKGIANLRGIITPVIDFAQLFDIEVQDAKKYYCILASDGQTRCTFYTSSIGEIYSVDLDTLSPVPEQSYKAEYVQGISAEDIILINLETILGDKSLVVEKYITQSD